MIICIPVKTDGTVDPRFGRAEWVAIAEVADGKINSWQNIEVSWDRLHDEGTDGSHHARVAKFLKEHQVDAVAAHHIGDGMVRMLSTMGISMHLEAAGEAKAVALACEKSQ